ncbi:hypothetical protein KMW28_23860 [Flammeovirga yaeyamensis]|uniref:Lipoprotein n=1 Tax=Flammeovirga yaeyamensis TaxID=367791 RepID=A0AAX1ND20_9BACT|nr:hypothetical protein [Flammeovirga yaeyamensis]MBB3696586.1 hypothetical protein [Flammeovirga yaeyamensis]NMF33263.1 hypothetical protein [Flammeovirga yaeyamensis]QWG05458.1 hypothetical protein KMW28_23860 [Flammeovirga yaeyamensis]
MKKIKLALLSLVVFLSCNKETVEIIEPITTTNNLKASYISNYVNGTSVLHLYEDNTFDYTSHTENVDTVFQDTEGLKSIYFTVYQYSKITLSGTVESMEELEDSNVAVTQFKFNVDHFSKRGYQGTWRPKDGVPNSIPRVLFEEEDVTSKFNLMILSKDKLATPSKEFEYQTKFALEK